MKRLVLSLFAVCVPVVAHAQVPVASMPREGVVAPMAAAASAAVVQTPGITRTTRPAMASGIENADIGNKVLVRVEAGRDLKAVDRAEFFSAKCGCYRNLPKTNPLYDADAPGPGPGQATRVNAMQLALRGEFAIGGRASVIGELPFRNVSPQAFIGGAYDSSSGLSDARVGAKFDLSHDANSQMTLEVLASAPTGDEAKALGTGHWSVTPTVLYSTRLGEKLAFETHFGTVFPLEGSTGVPGASEKFAGRVITFGVAPTFDAYTSGNVHVAPVVEVVGWRVLDGYSTYDGAAANGTTIVNLNIGARVVRGINSVYVGWGKALTDATWFANALRVELRHGF